MRTIYRCVSAKDFYESMLEHKCCSDYPSDMHNIVYAGDENGFRKSTCEICHDSWIISETTHFNSLGEKGVADLIFNTNRRRMRSEIRIPSWVGVTNPMIKLSEIKGRRFQIVDREVPSSLGTVTSAKIATSAITTSKMATYPGSPKTSLIHRCINAKHYYQLMRDHVCDHEDAAFQPYDKANPDFTSAICSGCGEVWKVAGRIISCFQSHDRSGDRLQQLLQLYDKGLISSNVLLEEFKIDPDMELEQLRFEKIEKSVSPLLPKAWERWRSLKPQVTDNTFQSSRNRDRFNQVLQLYDKGLLSSYTVQKEFERLSVLPTSKEEIERVQKLLAQTCNDPNMVMVTGQEWPEMQWYKFLKQANDNFTLGMANLRKKEAEQAEEDRKIFKAIEDAADKDDEIGKVLINPYTLAKVEVTRFPCEFEMKVDRATEGADVCVGQLLGVDNSGKLIPVKMGQSCIGVVSGMSRSSPEGDIVVTVRQM